MIAGAVFTSIGGVATTSARNWWFPAATMATFDRAENLDSARPLGRSNRRCVVGHGPATHGPAAAKDRAIARGASTPSPPDQRVTVADRPDRDRYEIELDGGRVGLLTYRLADAMSPTATPRSIRRSAAAGLGSAWCALRSMTPVRED